MAAAPRGKPLARPRQLMAADFRAHDLLQRDSMRTPTPTLPLSGGGSAPPRLHRSRQAEQRYTSFTFFSGRLRTGLPVAAKIAFSTAGAATQIVGSPTPPQKS